MKSRKQIRQRLGGFYEEVQSKRKSKKMKLQVDQEFQQIRIKDLNELNNVEMFSTSLRGGKAFVAEQKIKELKTRISKLNGQKLKISPKKKRNLNTKHEHSTKQKLWFFAQRSRRSRMKE